MRRWLDSYFINYNETSEEELRFRSNNICKSFNRKLNRTVGSSKPRFGVFVDKVLG